MAATTRYLRALLSGSTAFRSIAKAQVRQASSCSGCTGKRCLSLAAAARQQQPAVQAERQPAGSSVVAAGASPGQEVISVKFTDGSTGELPFVWLRDNCQCDQCYSTQALGRKMLFTDLDVNVRPTLVQEHDGCLAVEWSDGHSSEFDGEWLQQRAFTPRARQLQRVRLALDRVPWDAGHQLREFEYEGVAEDEETMLQWLLTMEVHGAAMLKNAPDRDVAGPEIIDRIAFVKPSHYGPHSPVVNRPNTNNVAFSNVKLGMHNDLTQYEYMAGIIFIHCLKQHIGSGGESVASDGLYAAEILRRDHPEAFRILTTTDLYFWDKGTANYPWEMDEFFKISKMPVITLNNDGEVIRIAVNHAVRDSHMDIPADKVKEFYAAFKLYNDLIYTHAKNFKMDSGDILTLDNRRCLHGREGYEAFSERHIESSYLDWDEARCRRRRLQEKFGLWK